MKLLTKSVFAACVLAVGFSTSALRAEDSAPKEKPAKKQGGGPGADRLHQLKEHLGLTEAQVGQIKAIMEDQKAALGALREKKLEEKEARAEMKKIREAAQAKIRAVLTPEQQAKFDALPKPEHKGPPGGPKGEDKQ